MHSKEVEHLLANATGPIRYKMTNDYMFRAILQKNEKALRGLLCALLHLRKEEIISIKITNPIILGETINEKTCILDINLVLNNNKIINIEMQVNNLGDWPERSLYYACKNLTHLPKGGDYSEILPVVHIGIIDFNLFEEDEEFYSEYFVMNKKTQRIYSDKLSMRVLQLSHIDNCTVEEKESGLYYWAQVFKAQTWEEVKILAEKSEAIEEAILTLKELTEEDKIRLQCEARERYEHDMASVRSYPRRMCEKAKREGLQQGLQEGLQQGKQLGEKNTLEKINQLNQFLVDDNRTEDLTRSFSDHEFQKQLLKEYSLI